MTVPNFTRRMILQSGIASCVTALGSGAGLAQSNERQVEGGIGGTGIVGLLTDIGSLYINGNYVVTDGRTAYSDGFAPIRKSSLSIGNSLTVEATGGANDLVARRVHITHPVVGTITLVSENGRTIRVNGVEVSLTRRLKSFTVGDRVAVSGLWRGDGVVASGLDTARESLDLVSGDVSRSGSVLRIGPVGVRGRGIANARNGGFATAIGIFDVTRQALVAQRVTAGRFIGAAGALQRLSVEGYLSPVDRAPGFRLAGLGHSFERNLSLGTYADKRVLFSGPYTGKFAAERATVLPEDAAARRRLLGRLNAQK